MELVCKKCGYKKDLGNIVKHKTLEFECPECHYVDMQLIDSCGVNIKVDGITEDTIINIVKELSKSISIADVIGFLGKKKKE